MSNNAYISPGVSVLEASSPSIAPLFANPATIAIVGAAQGFQSATQRLILTGITPVTLANTGINLSSLTVVDNATGATIAAGNYYAVQSSNPDGISNSGDETFTVQRVAQPGTAPSVAAGTGGITGTYVYAVTFVNPLGETQLGPVSSQIVLSAQGTNLSNIPLDTTNPTAARATARNIYRAKVTSSVVGTFYLVATIADNTTTTLTGENLSDSSALTQPTSPLGIVSGGQTLVSYQFTNQYYYNPQTFVNFKDIVSAYGPPFDSNGNISSQLSAAASFAFVNGATEIIGIAAKTSGDTDIENAIQQLVNVDVSLVTAVSGSSNVHSALAAHCVAMKSQGLFRIGVVGRDGTAVAGSYTPGQLQASAQAFNQENFVLVSPAQFIFTNPTDSSKTYNVGSQWAAAAVLGMLAARDVQIPLTRKTIAGFAGIADTRTPTQQLQDSQAGLLEVIQVGGSNGPLQIRHGVTTAVTNINTAEISVVRAKYEMADRLQTALNGSVVGQVLPIADVPLSVRNVVTGVLEQLVVEGAISAYANVTARIVSNNPTEVEVSFVYLPAFPINNVVVTFTIDTNSGDFNISGVTV